VLGENLCEQRPHLKDRWHLLKRDPLRPDRERPPQRLNDKDASAVLALLSELGAPVSTRGEFERAAHAQLLVTPATTLPRHRPRLARRRSDQARHRRERERIPLGYVATDRRETSSVARVARVAVPLDAERVDAEVTRRDIPATRLRACEQIEHSCLGVHGHWASPPST
jgi:hypothetical protein